MDEFGLDPNQDIQQVYDNALDSMRVIFETPNLFAAYTNLIEAECLDENCSQIND